MHPKSTFINVANTDFIVAQNREAFEKALREAPSTFGTTWPLVINGEKISTSETVLSINPAHPGQIIGYWSKATINHADDAVKSARSAWSAWKSTSVENRATIIERVGQLIQDRRFYWNSLLVYEAGKTWHEADIDISEAVDFCFYYACEMRRLAQPSLNQQVQNEENFTAFTPRGVGVVIAPWNFPLAILCGMIVAPLVAGNTVVFKPAEQTSIIGASFMDLLSEAGVPPGVANLITGIGEEVGAHLVAHPDIDFVVFTGSRAVGTEIWKNAARVYPGQRNLKKVVCEMGGKNALIIDESADLTKAVPAAVQSAFGYSGQKCSALSRLVVHDRIYDEFVESFLHAVADVSLGDPVDYGSAMGPVIDADAQQKILEYIEIGKKEAKLAYQSAAPEEGYYIPKTVFVDVPPDAVIAREEIFGPVVAIIRADDLDDALDIANNTDYALTGGMFATDPAALERAKNEFLVGNLYLNRTITGAVVQRQPFGGFKMSGAGTKQGGIHYLENFLFLRTITEKIVE
jgi:RHH-type proline utilization regulon transcriptional repressor/proline dehydrogenase/delta 1-pyrroline-5-carboxylate dehydrogenase